MFVSLNVLFYWSCIDHSRSPNSLLYNTKRFRSFLYTKRPVWFISWLNLLLSHQLIEKCPSSTCEKRMRWVQRAEISNETLIHSLVIYYEELNWKSTNPQICLWFILLWFNWTKKNKIWIKMLPKRQCLGTLRVFLRCAIKRREWGIE